MKTFLVEVEDSDGFDSTQEVRAKTEREARQKAIDRHYCDAGYHDWRSDDSPCPAIITAMVQHD